MTQKARSELGLPVPIREEAVRIGANIRLARRRRGITQAEMAERMFVTRKTLSRLEQGEVSVSIGVLLSALWVLGLDRDIIGLADPAMDVVGVQRERARLPKRVRKPLAETVNF
jgi:transcriptional regulator with XRE-family HTH domain